MNDQRLVVIRRSSVGDSVNGVEDVGDVYVTRGFGADTFSSTKSVADAARFTMADAQQLLISGKWRTDDPRLVPVEQAEDLPVLQL